MSYDRTLARVETYFDKTATQTWDRLTSDAKVSRRVGLKHRHQPVVSKPLLLRFKIEIGYRLPVEGGIAPLMLCDQLAHEGADVPLALNEAVKDWGEIREHRRLQGPLPIQVRPSVRAPWLDPRERARACRGDPSIRPDICENACRQLALADMPSNPER